MLTQLVDIGTLFKSHGFGLKEHFENVNQGPGGAPESKDLGAQDALDTHNTVQVDFADAHGGTEAAREEESDEDVAAVVAADVAAAADVAVAAAADVAAVAAADVAAADVAAVAAADVAAAVAAADVAVAATDLAAVVAEGTGRGRGNAVDSAVCTHRAVKEFHKPF